MHSTLYMLSPIRLSHAWSVKTL